MRLRTILRGGRRASPPPPSGDSAKAGINLPYGAGSYFGHYYPFLNFLRSGNGWQNVNGGAGVVINATTGHLTTLPHGTDCRASLAFNMGPNWPYFPPGEYVAKCSAGVTLSVQATTGVTQGVQSPGRMKFTVASNADFENMFLGIWATNNTGVPANLTDIGVFPVAEEASYDSGEIWNAAFLSHIQGIGVLRPMQVTGVVNSYPSSYAEFPKEDWFVWFHNSTWPVTLMPKLCQRFNKLLYTTFPAGWQHFSLIVDVGANVITTTREFNDGVPFAHGWSENEPFSFSNWEQFAAPTYAGGQLNIGVRYYAVQVTPTTFKIALTENGAALDLTAVTGAPGNTYSTVGWHRSVEQMHLDIAAAMYAVAPNLRLQSEVWNEIWNYDEASFKWGLAPAYGLGNDQAAAQAHVSLIMWKAIETYYPRNQHIRTLAAQGAWFERKETMFDYVDPGILAAPGTVMKNIVDQYAIAPYIQHGVEIGWGFDVDFTTNTLTTKKDPIRNIDVAHGFSDGDPIHFFDGWGAQRLPAPLNMNTTYYVRDKTTYTFKVAYDNVGGAAIDLTGYAGGTWAGNAIFPNGPYNGWVYKDAQGAIERLLIRGMDTASDDEWEFTLQYWMGFGIGSPVEYSKHSKEKLALINPAIKLTTYEAGTEAIGRGAGGDAVRWEALRARHEAFHMSARMADVYALYNTHVMLANDMQVFMQFVDCGAWRGQITPGPDDGFYAYGLLRWIGDTPTPKYTWFKQNV